AIIASTLESGEITINVTSRGLQSSKLTIQSHSEAITITGQQEQLPLYAYSSQNEHDFAKLQHDIEQDDIPIRKIELIAPSGTSLSARQKTINLTAKLYPVNATYHNVTWRLTNVTGADATVAKLIAEGLDATIHALGDGDVYVRCGTN